MTGAGKPYGLEPAGLDAMDVTRVEAGFILNGIDYFSALHCMIEPRKSSPFELALGWAVHLKRAAKAPFIGSEALIEEKKNGPARKGPTRKGSARKKPTWKGPAKVSRKRRVRAVGSRR